jgi:hypothetical protein
VNKFLSILFAIQISSYGYFPIAIGHRFHICGTVVDENLDPIHDTLLIKTTADYPLMELSGKIYTKDRSYKITDGRFCLDAYFSLKLVAWVSGKDIRGSYLSAMNKSLNVENFKWVVDRNPLMSSTIRRGPETEVDFVVSDTGEEWGYSVSEGRLRFKKDNEIDVRIYPERVKVLSQMENVILDGANVEQQLKSWLNRHPGTIKMEPGEGLTGTWKFVKPQVALDYFMVQNKDSLYLIPGPIAKTKFIPASLDSPVCNFGRLPGPPSLTDPRWRDSLLVAVHDELVIDAYYVQFPWCKKWGKVILDPKIRRDSSKVQVTVSQILKDMSDTSSFLFWRAPDEFQKCPTKVEAYRKMDQYRGVWESP